MPKRRKPRKRSQAFWKQTVEDYDRVSGVQSLSTFAHSRGVAPSSLYRWRKKLAREQAEVEAEEHDADVDVQASTQPTASLIPVVLRERVAAPVARRGGKTPAVRIQLTSPPSIEILAPQRVPVEWLVELTRALAEVVS